jgi:hypothetical protein
VRLRLAPVEYKVCGTEDCSSIYEGAQCPQCRQPFDPGKMRKELHDRLILVDIDPSIYEQTQRCRCTGCKNLYALGESEVVAHAQCGQCQEPLFRREQLQKIWQDAETLLQKARKLDKARGQTPVCPHCTRPVSAVCWCPLSHSIAHSIATSGLPQNPIMVWVRTFHLGESLEELQVREWREGESEEDNWLETERETEIESGVTKVSPDAQEPDE